MLEQPLLRDQVSPVTVAVDHCAAASVCATNQGSREQMQAKTCGEGCGRLTDSATAVSIDHMKQIGM